MNSIQLVVFDIAGTTVHDGDSVLRAFQESLAGADIVVPVARINAVMGLPKKIAVRQLLAEMGRSADNALVDRLHADFVARMKRHYAERSDIREIPGASAAFAELRRRGIKVALDTGFSRDIVDILLRRLDWRVPETIDAVVCSDEVARGRPHPDMILRLMTMLDIGDPRRIAKVGDTTSDLEEGASAGCGINIAVLTGAATREELATRPHTHIVASVAEVMPLLLEDR